MTARDDSLHRRNCPAEITSISFPRAIERRGGVLQASDDYLDIILNNNNNSKPVIGKAIVLNLDTVRFIYYSMLVDRYRGDLRSSK
jgi:hypothetical protein